MKNRKENAIMILAIVGKKDSHKNAILPLLSTKIPFFISIDIEEKVFADDEELLLKAKNVSEKGNFVVAISEFRSKELRNKFLKNDEDVIVLIKNKTTDKFDIGYYEYDDIENIEYIDNIDIDNFYDKYIKNKVEKDIFL